MSVFNEPVSVLVTLPLFATESGVFLLLLSHYYFRVLNAEFRSWNIENTYTRES